MPPEHAHGADYARHRNAGPCGTTAATTTATTVPWPKHHALTTASTAATARSTTALPNGDRNTEHHAHCRRFATADATTTAAFAMTAHPAYTLTADWHTTARVRA